MYIRIGTTYFWIKTCHVTSPNTMPGRRKGSWHCEEDSLLACRGSMWLLNVVDPNSFIWNYVYIYIHIYIYVNAKKNAILLYPLISYSWSSFFTKTYRSPYVTCSLHHQCPKHHPSRLPPAAHAFEELCHVHGLAGPWSEAKPKVLPMDLWLICLIYGWYMLNLWLIYGEPTRKVLPITFCLPNFVSFGTAFWVPHLPSSTSMEGRESPSAASVSTAPILGGYGRWRMSICLPSGVIKT